MPQSRLRTPRPDRPAGVVPSRAAPAAASRARARSRAVLAGAGVVLLGLALPAIAPADVLRLETVPRSAHARASVLGTGGAVRALPPVRIGTDAFLDPARLLASPDGRYVAYTAWGGDADTVDVRVTLVPTDGSPSRILRVSGTRWLKTGGDPVWSADGRELVLSAVRPVLRPRGGHRRLGPAATVRCVVGTGRCRRVPGTGQRLTAPLPDGRLAASDLTWPGREALTPCGWRLFRIEGSQGPAPRKDSRCGRFLPRFLATPVTLDARIYPGGARPSEVRARWTGTLRGGIPRASDIVASSAGVLIQRERLRFQLTPRRGRHVPSELDGSMRRTTALLVDPSGRARTVPAPNVATDAGRHPTVTPAYPLPDGGWLGSVGGQNGGRQAELLTVTGPTGHTRSVRIGGAEATPDVVARAAGAGLAADDAEMSLAGYEHATDSAIVVVAPIPRASAVDDRPATVGGEDETPEDVPPASLVRVPLHDGRPVVLESVPDPDGRVYAAW